jgi:hypothetical protein
VFEWGHSAFTKNLLSGLRDSKADTDSDGIITVQELGTYLQKKVTIDSDNRQTPKTRNLSSDEGEFVFVYAENSAVIQDKSTDEKLDLVPSDKEEVKSQQSSDDMKKWTTNRDFVFDGGRHVMSFGGNFGKESGRRRKLQSLSGRRVIFNRPSHTRAP